MPPSRLSYQRHVRKAEGQAVEHLFGRFAFIQQRQESSLSGYQYSGNHKCRGYATCGAVRSVRARW